MQPIIKRNISVKRILLFSKAISIGAPVEKTFTPKIKITWLITQSVKTLTLLDVLAAIHITASKTRVGFPMVSVFIFTYNLTFKIFNSNAQVRFADMHF